MICGPGAGVCRTVQFRREAALSRLKSVFAGLVLAALCSPGAVAAPTGGWPGWGGLLAGNQRQAPYETIISPGTVGKLVAKWSFTSAGNIASTPTALDGVVYFDDDWGGVYALSARTGKQIWMRWMSSYTGQNSSESRSSPAISGSLLILADRRSGNVVGVDRSTGSMVWETDVDQGAQKNPWLMLTASPVVHDGVVYIGTSSSEEYAVTQSTSYVPSFRGSVTALNAATGQIIWQSFVVPQGFTGGAIWGSGFPISDSLGLIYVATGNNYTLPQPVTACIAAAASNVARQACLGPTDYVDAVVALDLKTGAVKWGRRLGGLDTYTSNCGSSAPAQPCPTPAGHDYDFGSAPNLLSVTANGTTTQLLGAGQKSGAYWALNPRNGAIVWKATPAPGGVRGGILFGSAVDANNVYVAENDANGLAYTLQPSGTTTTGGSWSALNVATGAVQWQTAAPGIAQYTSASPAGAEGAVSVANGVVFGGDTGGYMVAMDATTGAVLWSVANAGTSITCGPAISEGVVYWGTNNLPSSSGVLYAFGMP